MLLTSIMHLLQPFLILNTKIEIRVLVETFLVIALAVVGVVGPHAVVAEVVVMMVIGISIGMAEVDMGAPTHLISEIRELHGSRHRLIYNSNISSVDFCPIHQPNQLPSPLQLITIWVLLIVRLSSSTR